MVKKKNVNFLDESARESKTNGMRSWALPWGTITKEKINLVRSSNFNTAKCNMKKSKIQK